MKKRDILKKSIPLFLGFMALVGCKEDEVAVEPSAITGLKATTTPGRIVLRWDSITDHTTIRYVQVKYYDPLIKKNSLRTASVFSDSILIPETRKKFGDYKFEVATVSPTNTIGATNSISIESEPAPSSWIDKDPVKVQLEASNLSTNAQESSEGPIANLLDGSTETFFHTSWSSTVPAPHWMQIELPNKITDALNFAYSPRNNGNNKPTDFDLLGSIDGENWFLIKNFTKDADGLPVTATDSYKSPTIILSEPVNYLRISVNKTNSGTVFWTMSEFSMNAIERILIDPEAEEE